jgi:hypothetical protein
VLYESWAGVLAPNGAFSFGSGPAAFSFRDPQALQRFIVRQLSAQPPSPTNGLPLTQPVCVYDAGVPPPADASGSPCVTPDAVDSYGPWLAHLIALKLNLVLQPVIGGGPASASLLQQSVFSAVAGASCGCVATGQLLADAEAAVSAPPASAAVWSYDTCARTAARSYNGGACPAGSESRPLCPAPAPSASVPLSPPPPAPPGPPGSCVGRCLPPVQPCPFPSIFTSVMWALRNASAVGSPGRLLQVGARGQRAGAHVT